MLSFLFGKHSFGNQWCQTQTREEWAQKRPEIGERVLGDFLSVFALFYGTYVQLIGLKAPGIYLDQFWSNKISVLLCEGAKPQNSMISGFVDPLGALISGLNIQKTLQKTDKYGHVLK